MRFFVIAMLFALLMPQGLAENIIRGTITISADGMITFEGRLERDNLNVTYAMLNTNRETPVSVEQSVYVVFNGTSLGHPPANMAYSNSSEVNTTDNYTYVNADSYNISLGEYLTLQHKGAPTNDTSSDKAFLEKRGDFWYFALHLDEWMDVYDLLIVLPEGTEFKEISTNMRYEKEGSSLHFEGVLVEAPKIDIIYSIKTPVAAEPANDSGGYLFFAVLCSALAIFFFFLPKMVKGKSLNDSIMKTLNERERGVILLLFENSGKLTQTRLRQKTGLPKSTLSNIIRDLENRKLVVRYEHGSTFDIELEKRVYA